MQVSSAPTRQRTIACGACRIRLRYFFGLFAAVLHFDTRATCFARWGGEWPLGTRWEDEEEQGKHRVARAAAGLDWASCKRISCKLEQGATVASLDGSDHEGARERMN